MRPHASAKIEKTKHSGCLEHISRFSTKTWHDAFQEEIPNSHPWKRETMRLGKNTSILALNDPTEQVGDMIGTVAARAKIIKENLASLVPAA